MRPHITLYFVIIFPPSLEMEPPHKIIRYGAPFFTKILGTVLKPPEELLQKSKSKMQNLRTIWNKIRYTGEQLDM